MTGVNFIAQSKEPTEVRLLSFHSKGVLSSLMTVFQRDGSHVLENNIPRLLNRQELLKIFTSLKGRERIYNDQVSKVNVVRKGRAGASSQEMESEVESH